MDGSKPGWSAKRLVAGLAMLAGAALALAVLAPAASAQEPEPPPEALPEIPCDYEAGDYPEEAILVACLRIRFDGGDAQFGSVESEIEGPIEIPMDIAATLDEEGEPEIVELGGDGDEGGLDFPSIELPGGFLAALRVEGLEPIVDPLIEVLEPILDPVTGVSADVQALDDVSTGDVDLAAFLSGDGELTTAGIPLRVKVNNLLLGDRCFIGSPDQPIDIQLPLLLSGGYMAPGGGAPEQGATGYARLDATDDQFAVPGARGCGVAGTGSLLGGLVNVNPFNDLINNQVGLPSPEGENLLAFEGWFGLRTLCLLDC